MGQDLEVIGDFPVTVVPIEPRLVVRPCPHAIPREDTSEDTTAIAIHGNTPSIGSLEAE